MTSPQEILSQGRDLHLQTDRIGRRMVLFEKLESTNTLALTLADDPRNDGLVLLAREQTAGRGQHGRAWQAPAGSSVLLSVLVFPPAHLCRPVVLTAWAAVAVCETVKQLARRVPHIKWPNDVRVQDRKLCGILIEQRAAGSGQLATAVGIGLNVNQPQEWFDAADLRDAISLACLDAGGDFEEVALQLVERLDEEYAPLFEGNLETLESRWAEYLALGQEDIFADLDDGGVLQAQLLKLSFDGVVIRSGGEEQHISPERIKHLRKA